MSRWKEVWVKGFMPQFSKERVEALKTALRENSTELLQGNTYARGECDPTSIPKAVRCCPVAFCAGGIGQNVDDVYYAFICAGSRCERELGGDQHKVFYEWWDKTPREEAFKQLLELIESTEQAA